MPVFYGVKPTWMTDKEWEENNRKIEEENAKRQQQIELITDAVWTVTRPLVRRWVETNLVNSNGATFMAPLMGSLSGYRTGPAHPLSAEAAKES